MYVAELQFSIIADTSYSLAEQAIRNYLEALIFNGQVLGREFPTYMQQDNFISRIILPETAALASHHHSKVANQALLALGDAGLAFPKLSVQGEDLMSNHTDPCQSPAALILYSRFGLMNSVLYCAEHFAPVPLYRFAPTSEADHQDLIRWQLQFQALDEIQMQETRVLRKTAENSLQQLHSTLNRQGRKFASQIARQQKIPVYFALYSGSSEHCDSEADKCCPGCGKAWLLEEPLHQLFDFQCQHCYLVSNIAWQCQ
jgi:predicted  nucleic acid-binding Zn ribbon protein